MCAQVRPPRVSRTPQCPSIPSRHAHDVLLRPPGHDCRVWQTNRVSGTEREWDGAVHPPWRGEVLPWAETRRGVAHARARTKRVPGPRSPDLPPRLIRSRLRPPLPLLALVRREELLRRLTAVEAPLLVVSAPGGSGKTVALSQWVQSDPRPVPGYRRTRPTTTPWSSCTTSPHPRRRSRHRSPGGRLAAAGAPAGGDAHLPALAAAVHDSAPFHLLVTTFTWSRTRHAGRSWPAPEQLPSEAQLCLSGRTAPALPLAGSAPPGACSRSTLRIWRSARGDHELLRLHGVAADVETVAYLERETQGWAAGLYLAALAGARMPAAEWLAGIHGHQRDIARYLASEFLEQQPPDVAEFLLRTRSSSVSPQPLPRGDRQREGGRYAARRRP